MIKIGSKVVFTKQLAFDNVRIEDRVRIQWIPEGDGWTEYEIEDGYVDKTTNKIYVKLKDHVVGYGETGHSIY